MADEDGTLKFVAGHIKPRLSDLDQSPDEIERLASTIELCVYNTVLSFIHMAEKECGHELPTTRATVVKLRDKAYIESQQT